MHQLINLLSKVLKLRAVKGWWHVWTRIINETIELTTLFNKNRAVFIELKYNLSFLRFHKSQKN